MGKHMQLTPFPLTVNKSASLFDITKVPENREQHKSEWRPVVTFYIFPFQ